MEKRKMVCIMCGKERDGLDVKDDHVITATGRSATALSASA
jgi:hypothetical protein